MSVQQTIAHNTIFNALGRIWEAVVNIGLTIYIVHRLGFDGYGTWSLVAVFTSYATLFDFGVSSAFTKYIAQHAARKEDNLVSAVLSTGVFFYLLLGIILVATGWPAIDYLINAVAQLLTFMHPDQAERYENITIIAEMRFLFRGALLLFVATNCLAPFTAIQTGLQRMGITNLLSLAASVIKVGATVVFLEMGHGVLGLLYANGLVMLAFGAASMVVAFYLYPNLRVSPFHINGAVFRTLFAFGWRTQVAKLSNLINFQTDRAVVGVFFGDMTLIGLYKAGEDLAFKVRQLPALVVSAMVPAVSDLDAREHHARIQELYIRSTKYIASVTVPLVLFAVATAELWLKAMFGAEEQLEVAAWIMIIICFGYMANLLPGPGISIALGKGRAELPMYAGVISMACNIALTILLVMSVGFYGVPVATALALWISTGWFFIAMKRVIDTPVHTLLRYAVLWPLLASMIPFIICMGIHHFLGEFEGRLYNLIPACILAALFGTTYVLLIRLTPFLDAFDVDFLADTLRLKRLPGFRFLVGRVPRA